MNKIMKDDLYTKTRDDLRSKDHSTVKVNGVETTVSKYYENPQGFNTAPMNKAFVSQMQTDHKQAVETKKKLQTNPHAVKALG